MGRIFITLVSLFVVVGGVLVFQATRGTSSLVLLPSELVAKAAANDLPRIRIGGRVADPISYQTEPKIVLTFNINKRTFCICNIEQ